MTKHTMLPEGHENHLCYLTNLHFHQTNWRNYKTSMKNAKGVCKTCGQSAGTKNDLCEPVFL